MTMHTNLGVVDRGSLSQWEGVNPEELQAPASAHYPRTLGMVCDDNRDGRPVLGHPVAALDRYVAICVANGMEKGCSNAVGDVLSVTALVWDAIGHRLSSLLDHSRAALAWVNGSFPIAS